MRAIRTPIWIWFLLILAAGSHEAGAASSRMTDRLGVYVSVLGDPFPSLYGGNVALNVSDWTRVTAGYGKISGEGVTLSTYAGGIKVVVGDWDFTPTFGLNLATVTLEGAFSPGSEDLYGFRQSGSHFYFTFGLDWQLEMGMYLGAGFNVSTGPGGALPYFNFGWFF